MAGWWRRIFKRDTAASEWERDEESPAVAREYEAEHESLEDRVSGRFAEEHLGLPPEPRDDDFPRD